MKKELYIPNEEEKIDISSDELKLLNDEGYEFISLYKIKGSGTHKRLQYKHLKCQKNNDVRAEKFFKEGQRCSCMRRIKFSKIQSEEDYQNEINLKRNNEYTLISEYKGRKFPVKIKHNCGYEYEIKRAEYLIDDSENSGCCPICYSTKNNKETLNFKFKKNNINITALEDPNYESKKVLVLNNDCNHKYEVFYLDVLAGRSYECPECRTKHKKNIDISYIKNEIYNLDNEYCVLSNEYNGTHSHLKIRHAKCGKEYFASRNNFLEGKRCPFCSAGNITSKGEREILDFIKSLGEENISKTKIQDENKKLFELDIYSESKNIGIEFNGLYWHSNKFKENSSMKDKLELCNKNKIRLINIFEDEWNFKKDIVKDKLKSIFKLEKNKIYARKCKVKEITNKEKDEFLEKNHIQGQDRSSLFLGLFYENELIAVMTFCKLRRNLGFKNSPEGCYELSRFAGKLGTSVIGGFSKLLKYSINNFNIKRIITYADLRWSSTDNNVYIKNGFNLDHISAPSYSYLDSNFKKRLPRFKFRKNNLKKLFPDIYSDEKSENEIMKEAGYFRIYDCGNAVYTLEIK